MLSGLIGLVNRILPTGFVPSEVRWSERNAGVSWTAGGEFDATVLSSVPGVSSAPSTQVFSSSQDFVDAAQSALDGDDTLQLILLAPVTEQTFTGSGSATLRFHSNDSGSPTERPLLTIDAVVREPSSLALPGAGIVGLLAYGWRKRR